MEIIYTILLGAVKVLALLIITIPFFVRIADMDSDSNPDYRKTNANILEKIYFLYYPNVVGYSSLLGLICGVLYLVGKIL